MPCKKAKRRSRKNLCVNFNVNIPMNPNGLAKWILISDVADVTFSTSADADADVRLSTSADADADVWYLVNQIFIVEVAKIF